MNRAATTIFSDEITNAEILSTTPASLSQKIHTCGGESASVSYRVSDSIPLPSYQRGRSGHRESFKRGDEFSFANTSLLSASKKQNRTRTVQSSRLSSLCDTESAHLLKSLLADLTQLPNASNGEPFSQHRRESAALSDSSESYSPLAAESMHYLGESYNPPAQERRPTNEPFGDDERDQSPAPVAYRHSGNNEPSHVLEVLPWLIEAIDTVNDLESRIHELEQDCKLIPFYEQNQAKMVEVIHNLESTLQLEQTRRNLTESAVRSSVDVLEDAMRSCSALSNSPAPHPLPTENTVSDPFSSQRLRENWGFVLETRGAENERSATTTIHHGREHIYQNAITITLEHLRAAKITPQEKNVRPRTSNQATDEWEETVRPMLDGLGIHQADIEGTTPTVAFKETCLSLKSSESMESFSTSTSTSTSTRAMLIGSTDNLLTNKATITGSAQSLATDLGCMMDERVYLKQHIQDLNRLRFQSQELAQRAEKEYQRQVADMVGLSKRLLESLGGLTLAQASLEGASELTIAALGTAENRHRPYQLQHGLLVRQLAESVQQMDDAIRIMKNVTGTCIDMVEKTCISGVQQTTAVIARAGSYATPFLLTPQRPVHPTHPLSKSEHGQEQNVRRMAVDDISLQEFEDHITALRRRRPVNMTVMQLASVCAADSSYMKQVLVQDIQPCLLMNQGQAYSCNKQSGWIGAMLHAKSTIGTGIHRKLGNTTHWHQRLLTAIERNECEIEYWTTSSLSGNNLSVPKTGAKSMAQNKQCCLCGLERTCEYRLWLKDQSDKKVHMGGAVRSSTQTADLRGQSFPLDLVCRGRVVAVCDFFMFMAHLRQGLLDQQPVLELYHRSLALRHRMASARIGCL
ncbi:RAB3A interacting protein [Podila clonocystis]|nr:RAB3A interacting protein [Podila clonocystis]